MCNCAFCILFGQLNSVAAFLDFYLSLLWLTDSTLRDILGVVSQIADDDVRGPDVMDELLVEEDYLSTGWVKGWNNKNKT